MQLFRRLPNVCRLISNIQPSPLNSAVPTLYTIQSRKTHIMKHVKVRKLMSEYPDEAPDPQQMHKLTDERYIYEQVRHEDSLPEAPTDVLLLQTVEGIGVQGEVVTLAPVKARKELLLTKFGVYASPYNLELYGHLRYSVSEDQPSSKYAAKTLSMLGAVVVTVTMNIEEPWQIEPWHLRVCLRKMGVNVPEYAIELPEEPIRGPNMDLQYKFFYITVTVNKREKVRVRCSVHHVAGDPKKRLAWTELTHCDVPPNAILPSQQAYLTALFEQRAPFAPYKEPQLTPEMLEQGRTSTSYDSPTEQE